MTIYRQEPKPTPKLPIESVAIVHCIEGRDKVAKYGHFVPHAGNYIHFYAQMGSGGSPRFIEGFTPEQLIDFANELIELAEQVKTSSTNNKENT